MARRKQASTELEKCHKCLQGKDFDEKRARDFKKEPLEFLRFYCDRQNIWEEGALLIRERLSKIREGKRLKKELKDILERIEGELLKRHWMNIPKHSSYDSDLKKIIRVFKATHPHLR